MIKTKVIPEVKDDRVFDVGDLVVYGNLSNKEGYVVLVTSLTGAEESTFSGINLGPVGPTTIGKIHTNYSKRAFRKYYGSVEITQEGPK